MKGSLFVRALIIATAMIAGVSRPATAQITTGTVAGSVKDDQGLRVPGATVTLVSEARGTRMAPVVTSTTGDFVVPNVAPDTYTIEVSMPGFKALKRAGIAVSGGDRVGVGELTMSVGGTSETITVTTEAPLIQSQSGERSFSITSAQVENLPIGGANGRSFSTVTALTPGVTGTNTRLGGGGQNNIMMDGVSTMDTGNNGQLLQMTPEAIAEVKVLTSGYQAEYGRSSGLQITAVTKSGSNRFHGSLYDVERNSDWNSNTWANKINGTPKAVDKQRDWGYTFGGPVGKPGGSNKLFFFYSTEYRPRNAANTLRQFRVPTAAERHGDFSQSLDNNGVAIPTLKDATGAGIVGNKIPASKLYQPGLNVLNMYPLPNEVQAPGTAYNLEFLSPSQKTLSYQPAIRGDYQFSSSLRVTAKYTGQKGFRGTTIGSLPGFNDTFSAYPWVHALATTVNYTLNATTFLEATYGFSNRRLGGVVNSSYTNRFNTGLNGIPQIFPDANILPAGSYNQRVMEDVAPPFYVNGRAELAPTFQWGALIGSAPPNLAYPAFLNTNPTQDISISMTKIVGPHTMKAGFYSNHSLKQQNLNQRNALPFQGDLSFANATTNQFDSGFGFANAALGIFTAYTQQSSFVEGKFVYNQIEAFAQDNWKVSSRLTLDYGLRFTHQVPQYDANGQASNFFADKFSAAATPLQYLPGCPGGAVSCETTRQALNPQTGKLMGAGTASLIGQIVPNTGSPTNGIVQAGKGISKYNYLWPSLAVAPRFGFAYDVTGHQSMVLRGGMGLFFDRPAGDSIYYQSQNPPTSTNQTVRNGRLQDLATAPASSGVPTIINYRYNNDSLPSSVQWNAGVQMALPWSSSLDISYVGQKSYSVLDQNDGTGAVNVNSIDLGAGFLAKNQDPTRSAAVTAVAGNGAYIQELLRPFRGYANIDQQWQFFHRTYHSLQFAANRRFRNGVSFGGNYTLSLSDTGTTGLPTSPVRLDHAADGSYTVRADQAAYEDLMKNTGLQRHTIKANFVWDLPDLHSDSGALKVVGYVVNDWQLSGILTAGSGTTYDISYAYQNNGANINLTGSPDYAARTVVNGATGSGCADSRFSQFTTTAFSGPLPGSLGLESGRNYMTGCADKTTDMSVSRSFRLGRGRSAQIRLDMFNAFNTVVYSGRQTQLQLVSPVNQTVRNSQFLADGTVDQTKLKTTSAGFGGATGAQALRTMQLQVRFAF
ncbi:MAG: carboxypeptidase regulatory-like domain-containing protein [Acidobacteriota bacterium]